MSGTRAALLVGADAYSDPRFARLRAPAHDVQALEAVLADPAIGDFDVRTLVNEPHGDVLEHIEDFFADRRPDDLLLLYFSCHGVKDVNGRLYFATTTTRFDRLGSTGLSSAWINEQLDRTRCRRAVLLLDCCYSGAFARGLAPRSANHVEVATEMGGRGRVVITAADAMEYAWEDDELSFDAAQPSVFTRALVTGLRTGEADRDGDGKVAVGELYDYLYEQVREATPHQSPTKSVFGEQGELVVARNPHPPRPATEPEPLSQELEAALFDRRPFIRKAAVVELQTLLAADAGLAVSAVRGLELLATDDDPQVRSAAGAALAEAARPGTTTRAAKSTADAESPADPEAVATPTNGHPVALQRKRDVAREEVALGWPYAAAVAIAIACLVLWVQRAFTDGQPFGPSAVVVLLTAALFLPPAGLVGWRGASRPLRLACCGLLAGIGLMLICGVVITLAFTAYSWETRAAGLAVPMAIPCIVACTAFWRAGLIAWRPQPWRSWRNGVIVVAAGAAYLALGSWYGLTAGVLLIHVLLLLGFLGASSVSPDRVAGMALLGFLLVAMLLGAYASVDPWSYWGDVSGNVPGGWFAALSLFLVPMAMAFAADRSGPEVSPRDDPSRAA